MKKEHFHNESKVKKICPAPNQPLSNRFGANHSGSGDERAHKGSQGP